MPVNTAFWSSVFYLKSYGKRNLIIVPGLVDLSHKEIQKRSKNSDR